MQLCFLLLVSSLVKKVGINSLLVSSLVDESGRTSVPPVSSFNQNLKEGELV